jgi:hypothetical protein
MTSEPGMNERPRRASVRFSRSGRPRTWRFWLCIAAALAVLAFGGAWIYLNYFYGDAPPPFKLSPTTP